MAEVVEGLVDRDVRVAAPPEVVFGFFTDPAKITRWMGRAATLDPRPGGIFRVEISPSDVARGEYVAVEPPRRVAFTWGWESGGAPLAPGASLVEVTFTPDGDGTRVRLVHTRLPAHLVKAHDDGWQGMLAQLVAVAS